MQHRELPDVQSAVDDLGAEKAERTIAIIDSDPRETGANEIDMRVNRLHIVIGDPGEFGNTAKCLSRRSLDIGQCWRVVFAAQSNQGVHGGILSTAFAASILSLARTIR
ncbi:hypothetical protein D9M72_636040 [compost metagenome]